MENEIINIDIASLYDLPGFDVLPGKFLVFNNYSEPINKFNIHKNIYVKINALLSLCCVKGLIKIQLGNKIYSITENTFMILYADRMFQVLEVSDDIKIEIMFIKDGVFDLGDNSKVIGMRTILSKSQIVELPPKQMKEIVSIFKTIRRVIRDKSNVFTPQIVRAYLNIMFYGLCSHLLNKEHQNKDAPHKEVVFKKFISDLETNYRRERNIKFYADKACLTPKYFSSLIYKQTGQHPSDWIKNYTIAKAKEMLMSGKLSIQQISYDLNFSSQSHFSFYFKQHTGFTPKEYQKI
ncbi:MAG: AraC family transcriptional regulator [Bacteroidales bacterium]|jgi:AraC-like DNA-binding protein|nr:AraC family transcriptional regulator [Bacteroidales bacterium]